MKLSSEQRADKFYLSFPNTVNFLLSGSAASYVAFAVTLPVAFMFCTHSMRQASRVVLLTLLMCVPRRLCTPEQSMHMNIPRFKLAQVGAVNPKVRSKLLEMIPKLLTL